jgi:hypothetical protein
MDFSESRASAMHEEPEGIDNTVVKPVRSANQRVEPHGGLVLNGKVPRYGGNDSEGEGSLVSVCLEVVKLHAHVLMSTRKDDGIVCYSNTSISGKSMQKPRVLFLTTFQAWCST